jgi:hypothetical protein
MLKWSTEVRQIDGAPGSGGRQIDAITVGRAPSRGSAGATPQAGVPRRAGASIAHAGDTAHDAHDHEAAALLQQGCRTAQHAVSAAADATTACHSIARAITALRSVCEWIVIAVEHAA